MFLKTVMISLMLACLMPVTIHAGLCAFGRSTTKATNLLKYDNFFKSVSPTRIDKINTVAEPPSTSLLLSEIPRAVGEGCSLFGSGWQSQLAKAPRGLGKPVLTIPGLGADDCSMYMMRKFLNDKGFNAYPWQLGCNIPEVRKTKLGEMIAYCEKREAQLVDRIEEIKKEAGMKVSLVGWSLGGIFANTLAQTHSDLIEQSILLGSPIGSPESTSAWYLLKFFNLLDVTDVGEDVEAWMDRKNQLADRKVNTTVIYSNMDGVVPPDSAVIQDDQYVQNIEVPSSHLGLAFNPLVYWVLADRLSQNPKNWKKFDVNMQPPRIQRCFNQ